MRVDQVGKGWDRGHGVSREKGGWTWTQLMKGLVSPTKFSETLGALGGFPDQLCISSLQPVWRIDWAGLRQGASTSWEAVIVIQKSMVATSGVAVGVARVAGF